MTGATLAQQIEREVVPHPLESAFRHFREASEKLERKYELLLKETQVLREQLAAKEDEVKRSERLAMLGETAAGIAHEVRNPLGAIKLFVSLLKQDLSEQPGPLELVQQIERGITSLDTVVSNILHLSKGSKPAFAPVNLHALLREQIAQLASLKPRAVFEASLEGNPFLQGNEGGLRQAIYNLLLNAVQAMSGEGRVAVSCGDGPDGSLVLQVRDSGPGIAAAVFDRIFDPFVSTKNEGTGLGLAIVKRIVDQHDAQISVRNCGGAEFTVIFRRKPGSAAQR